MIEASLYKLVRTQAFGDYKSACANALNPAVTTDAIEMINLDYPELDIKKARYVMMRRQGRRQDASMLKQ